MTMVEKNCKACGCMIKVRLADHKRGWGNFCNKSCSAAYKYGHRPRDVNRQHAKHSDWACQAVKVRDNVFSGKFPKASTIEAQVGNVRVKHKIHSPVKKYNCAECGNSNSSYCIDCDIHYDALDDVEGWDDHKIWTS